MTYVRNVNAQRDLEAQLQERLTRTFGKLTPGAFATRTRAIVGTDQLPDNANGHLALTALQKLRTAGDRPTAAEFAALEYMIRAMRPAMLVQGNTVEASTDQDFNRAFADWNIGFRNALPAIAESVGRISKVRMEAGARTWAPQGTAFVVAPGVLMTNTHVLDALSNGQRMLERGQAVIEFRCEAKTQDGGGGREPVFEVDSVMCVHPDEDACLLRFDGGPGTMPLRFHIEDLPELAPVVAIGFPFPDPERDPAFVAGMLGVVKGKKRAAPGLVTGRQQRGATTLYHDCSTLGGNSGSPLLLLGDCTVAGLHRGGGFLWKNMAVDAKLLASWVREETTYGN